MSLPAAFAEGRALSQLVQVESGMGFAWKGGTSLLLGVLDHGFYLRPQTIAMGNADHTLVVNTAAGANQSRIEGGVLHVSCTVGSHNLTFPAEADISGLYLVINNTGAQNVVLRSDTPAVLLTMPANSTAIVTCDGTTIRAAFSPGATGAVVNLTMTGYLDQDYAMGGGVWDGINSASTINSAAQSVDGADISVAQTVTARTGGTVRGVVSSVTGLAGDVAGTYVSYDGVATDNGGAGVFVWGRMDAGFDALFDASAAATGEADFILGANLASAMAWRIGATDVLSLDTTTNLRALDLDAMLDVDYALAAAGNLADMALSVVAAAGNYTVLALSTIHDGNRAAATQTTGLSVTLDSAAGDDPAAVYNGISLLTDGTQGVHNAMTVTAGFDAFLDASNAATGEADVVLGANLASAFAFRVAAVDVASFDTTTGLWAFDLDATTDQDYTSINAAGFTGRDGAFTLSDVAGTAALVGDAVTVTAGTDRQAACAAFTARSTTLAGRAGDNAAARYIGHSFATNGLGGGLHTAMSVGANFDALLDISAAATGEADVILGDNLASAMQWRIGATGILTLVTSTGLREITAGTLWNQDYSRTTAGALAAHDLTVSDAAAAMDVGYFANVHDSARNAASVVNGMRVVLDSDAADDAAAIYRAYRAETDGTDGVHTALSVGAGFDRTLDFSACATGENVIAVPTNVAIAARITDLTAALDYITLVSSTGSERVNVGQRLTTTDGVPSGLVKTVGGLAHAAPDSAAITGNAKALFNNNRTIPANTLKVGSVVRITWKAVCTAITGGGDTLQSELVIGPTPWNDGTDVVISDSGAVAVGANNIFVGKTELVVKTNGAGGTFDAVSMYHAYAAPGTAIISGEVDGGAVNTTVENVIGLTAVFSTADTGNTAVCEVLDIEII